MIINHKKVVFIGASSRLLFVSIEFIKEFTDKHCNVILILPKSAESPNQDPLCLKALQDLECRIIFLNFENTSVNPAQDLKFLCALWKIFKEERPDILLNYAIKSVLYGSLMGFFFRNLKIFSTITGMGTLYTKDTFRTQVIRFFTNTLYKIVGEKNSAIFFLNTVDQDFFIQNKFIPIEKAILQNGAGVNVDRFGQTPLPEEKIFLFVARLIKEKGLLEYIDASSRLKKKYPDTRFQILGGAHTNPSAIPLSRVERLCKEGGIEYLGEHPSAFPFLQKCSVFVLPSYREGTPVSGMEALSVGRPIIITDVPGCGYLVDKDNGILIPSQDAQALYDAMEKMILASHEELVQMGSRSRALAEERFDVHKVNKVTLDAIERC